MANMNDSQWRAWRSQLVPLLYDWFSNHNLTWPSQACRWGRLLEELPYKSRHRIFYSEQTNPELASKEPPKLLVAEAEMPKPRVAASELVSSWTDMGRCPFIKDVKAIVHPGEVNKIRELPQHPDVVVTHTDAAELFVWNTATQPNKGPDPVTREWGSSTPELTLLGHRDQAQFPLATSAHTPMVASGGTDRLVLLWDLQDAARAGGILEAQPDGAGTDEQQQGPSRTTELRARHTLVGHTDTVEDLVFRPGSSSLLVSVGDDKQVLFWDTSAGSAPVAAIKAAHGSGPDVHCVDWSELQEHLLVTGAADGSLKVWDRRKLPASGASSSSAAASASSVEVAAFSFHTDAIMRVEWSPHTRGILASGGEDHLVVVWSLDKGAEAAAAAAAAGGGGGSKATKGGRGSKASRASRDDGDGGDTPPEVLFKHVGHRDGKVVDFQWCPQDPWTLLSVSEAHFDDADGEDDDDADEGSSRGGGALQIWRINDLVYRQEEEVVQELEAHKEWILHGRKPPAAVLAHIEAQQQVLLADAMAAAQQQQQQQQGQVPGGQQQQQRGNLGADEAGGSTRAGGSSAGGNEDEASAGSRGDAPATPPAAAAGGSGSAGSGGGLMGPQDEGEDDGAGGGGALAGAAMSGDNDAASTQPMDEG